MKTQINVCTAAATKAEDATTVKKTNKWDVEKVEEEVKNGVESAPAVAENWLDWDELPLVLTREVVDEQISWGHFSQPIWGVEAYGSLSSDAVWDDDIWSLESIKEYQRIHERQVGSYPVVSFSLEFSI